MKKHINPNNRAYPALVSIPDLTLSRSPRSLSSVLIRSETLGETFLAQCSTCATTPPVCRFECGMVITGWRATTNDKFPSGPIFRRSNVHAKYIDSSVPFLGVVFRLQKVLPSRRIFLADDSTTTFGARLPRNMA